MSKIKKNKKNILIPEVKININQLKKTRRVCPISGWIANSDAIPKVIKKVNEYLKNKLVYFALLNIELMRIIKKGLTISIGWNLGKKFKSIHLFDPLTSMPINGTNIKVIIDNKKINIANLNNFSWSIEDNVKIIIAPIKIKIKCLKKNE